MSMLPGPLTVSRHMPLFAFLNVSQTEPLTVTVKRFHCCAPVPLHGYCWTGALALIVSFQGWCGRKLEPETLP